MADAADATSAAVDTTGRPVLVLASGSPRRLELFGRLGVAFEVRVPGIDETPLAGESPVAYVERVARAKATEARAHAEHRDELIVAADTTVDVDGEIVGKPADAAAATASLARLSGRTHLVHTGVAVCRVRDSSARSPRRR